MRGAFLRYRVMAFVVGTALLCLFGIVLAQWAGARPGTLGKVVAIAHGYLYLVYLASAADLARRARWRLGRILMVVCAGFVPFLAFYVEHRVNVQMQAEWAAEAAGAGAEVPVAGDAGTR